MARILRHETRRRERLRLRRHQRPRGAQRLQLCRLRPRGAVRPRRARPGRCRGCSAGIRPAAVPARPPGRHPRRFRHHARRRRPASIGPLRHSPQSRPLPGGRPGRHGGGGYQTAPLCGRREGRPGRGPCRLAGPHRPGVCVFRFRVAAPQNGQGPVRPRPLLPGSTHRT